MTEWEEWCLKERGRVLTGTYAHFCIDWDGLTMDETCDGEWPCICKSDIDDQIDLGIWPVCPGEKS